MSAFNERNIMPVLFLSDLDLSKVFDAMNHEI